MRLIHPIQYVLHHIVANHAPRNSLKLPLAKYKMNILEITLKHHIETINV